MGHWSGCAWIDFHQLVEALVQRVAARSVRNGLMLKTVSMFAVVLSATQGNTKCWDDVYTFETCCVAGGSGKAVDFGCGSPYFKRFLEVICMLLACACFE